jgi:hypothetical protein
VTVDRAQINYPARPTARAEDVEPWRSGDLGGADGRRPQHVTAGWTGRLEHAAGANSADCAAHHLPPVAAEIVDNGDVAGPGRLRLTASGRTLTGRKPNFASDSAPGRWGTNGRLHG